MDNGEPSKQAGEEMADDFRTGLNTAKELGFPSRPSSKPHNRPQGHPEAPEGISRGNGPGYQPGQGSSYSAQPDSSGDKADGAGGKPGESGGKTDETGQTANQARGGPEGPSQGRQGASDSSGKSPDSSLEGSSRGAPGRSGGLSDLGTGFPESGTGTAGLGGSAGTAGAAEGAAGTAAGAAVGGSAGTAAGAAAGATAGSVAGPAGTAAGAAAGLVLPGILKVAICFALMIAVCMAFFMSIPSFLFDNPDATVNRQVLEETYNNYYNMISDEYLNDIWRAQEAAEADTAKIFAEAGGSVSGVTEPPSLYPHIRMQDSERDKLSSFLDSSDYDSLVFHKSTLFLRSVEEYEKAAQSNINLVLSLIDTQKKNWFSSIFESVADKITGGWYSEFTTWIDSKWNGFWQEFIQQDLYSITVGDTWVEEIEYHTPDGLPYYRRIAHVTIDYTYDLKDRGIAFYADKVGANQDQIDRAAEMANYLADLFGSTSDEYFGMWVDGGYYTDAIQGGTVGNNIANALVQLKDKVSGMEYDPGGTFVFPLQGYDHPPMSSHYGPRQLASDPWHTGIDFAAPTGTPILSAMDGVVLFTAQMPNGFGNYIVVYHGDSNGEPVATMYGHMSAFGSYRAGDRVSAGDVIGYVGSTGLSTGPHLHFQLHVGDVTQNPVEFFEYLSYLRPYD